MSKALATAQAPASGGLLRRALQLRDRVQTDVAVNREPVSTTRDAASVPVTANASSDEKKKPSHRFSNRRPFVPKPLSVRS